MVRPEIKKKRLQLAEAAKKSKKALKELEKVNLRRKSKVDRNILLKNIKKCQLLPHQLDQLHSTSSMQTKGKKRFTEDGTIINGESNECIDPRALIKIKRRKLRLSISSSSSSSEDTEAISSEDEVKSPENVIYESCSTTKVDEKPLTHTAEEKPESLKSTSHVEIKQEPATAVILKEEIREPSIFVQVSRLPEVEESRLRLPIINEEQNIMEMIRYNDVVLIAGETGSGKTTQLPQFLYEAGYALDGDMIGITEPRRVAAVSMSERVAHELNLTSQDVSYQIRFSGNVTEKTKIKFMTDGVLLRECQQDLLLSKYSAIIIDEAHERSIFSDLLIGLLSRIVPLRRKRGSPLKLIIMSATLKVSDFAQNSCLFRQPPPMINIEARQFPVTVKFAKQTPIDYLQAAYKKVCAVHSKMPKGGILVFVTSQLEVRLLCKKLKDKYSKLHCLGLYAMLPLEKQRLVFKNPPEGFRLCVVATNVAETSITIPNIKYVIDTGMEKTKLYDAVTGVSRFIVTWTSKSSAQQRMGRAGRMGPGYCYRLYSSAVYVNDLPDYAEPPILQRPVEDVLLQMKSMNIDNVINFPFPTRPPLEALKAAEKRLILLGALEKFKSEPLPRLTKLGKAMSNFAVGARCAKMLVLSPADLLPHVMALVSAMTVREMFVEGSEWKEIRKKWAGHRGSKLLGDFGLMIRSICAVNSSSLPKNHDKICLKYGLRPKAMSEIDKLRKQLTREITKKSKVKTLKKPTENQTQVLRQLIFSSYCDHIAKKQGSNTYACAETDESVYISPGSILRGQKPEYLIYRELYKGETKMFIRDLAVIEPNWLIQCDE